MAKTIGVVMLLSLLLSIAQLGRTDPPKNGAHASKAAVSEPIQPRRNGIIFDDGFPF